MLLVRGGVLFGISGLSKLESIQDIRGDKKNINIFPEKIKDFDVGDLGFVQEAGNFPLRIGDSSEDQLRAEFVDIFLDMAKPFLR